MKKVAQTVLPFKVAATEESLTAQAGLLLFGEFALGQGLERCLAQEMPRPGSGHAYTAFGHSFPLLQTLAGGDHLLGDLRMIHGDSVLRRLLPLARVPSTDATGDWLRRMGSGKGLASLSRVNQRMVARRLRQIGRKVHTLDIDATQIVAERRTTAWTYKGERGHLPMVGHLAEDGVVIHDEFRAGNVAPAWGHLAFLTACEKRLARGHRIPAIRADAASYQAEIFNRCEATGRTFAIDGRLNAPTLAAIAALAEFFTEIRQRSYAAAQDSTG